MRGTLAVLQHCLDTLMVAWSPCKIAGSRLPWIPMSLPAQRKEGRATTKTPRCKKTAIPTILKRVSDGNHSSHTHACTSRNRVWLHLSSRVGGTTSRALATRLERRKYLRRYHHHRFARVCTHHFSKEKGRSTFRDGRHYDGKYAERRWENLQQHR